MTSLTPRRSPARSLAPLLVAGLSALGSACTSDPGGQTDTGTDGGDCNGAGWQAPVAYPIETAGTIVALGSDGLYLELLLQAGQFVRIDEGSESSEVLPGTGGLRALSHPGAYTLVVGDGGQILRREGSWSLIDAGVSEDLIDVTATGPNTLLALASTRLLYSSSQGLTWSDVAAPSGSWAGLRRVLSAGDQLLLIGDGGQVWQSASEMGEWTAVEIGTSSDLIDGVDVGCSGCALLLAADALHLRDTAGGEWITIAAPDGEALTAVGGPYVTTDAKLYQIDPYAEPPALVELTAVTRPTKAIVERSSEELFLLGTDGSLELVQFYLCI